MSEADKWKFLLEVVLGLFRLFGFIALLALIFEYYKNWIITIMGIIYGAWWLNRNYEIKKHINNVIDIIKD